MEKLILASSSPRRKEILLMLGLPFISIHPDIDESVCDHLAPIERVLALAELKTRAGLVLVDHGERKQSVILGADTLVALKLRKSWKVIGKPSSRDEAGTMLGMIQGRLQHVFTGICLLDGEKGLVKTALCHSTVQFAPMSPHEIEAYLEREEWEGAAGAYRIQGWGSAYIERIDGSPSGVMGLPIHELYGILKEVDFVLPRPLINVL
ncbi:MAG: Maf family protein [Spirochaetes bacterium]|nr:Maf family protein [Spirochaetota bacterium]